MADRPILFSAPMVCAILSGTKTQTRRVVTPQFVADALPVEMPATDPAGGWVVPGHSGTWWCEAAANPDDARRCPYGQPGDRLWVREAWRTVAEADALPPRDLTPAHRLWYEEEAPHQTGFGKLRPGMFMPRWASRITLEVTGVRVERLQDISEEDAISEGIESQSIGWRHYVDPVRFSCLSPLGSYHTLWDSINGPESWDSNPWVWVISFRRL